MVRIAPSLLSADFTNLSSELYKIKNAGLDILHLDIMDGSFVPNITFGPNQVAAMRKATDLVFDTHLMINSPDRYIKAFAEAGSDIITVHFEACRHLQRTLASVRALGKKAGVALNPATIPENLKYVLDDVDLILVMSVNPGFGGQSYIPVSTQKIADVKKLIGDRNIIIEVDGGINDSNAKQACEAGAELLVSGSYMFKGSMKENADKLYLNLNRN